MRAEYLPKSFEIEKHKVLYFDRRVLDSNQKKEERFSLANFSLASQPKKRRSLTE